MLSKKEIKRLTELEKMAMDNFLENADYYPEDWLNESDKEEYTILRDRFEVERK